MAAPRTSDSALRFAVRGVVWIETEGRPFLGPGRSDLLRAVERCGSVAGAARTIGLSYRAAWERIDTMNRRARRPLVTLARGGRRGGGAQLTDFGRAAVRLYDRLAVRFAAFRARAENDIARRAERDRAGSR